MGCDIHCHLEYYVDGEFRDIDLYKKNIGDDSTDEFIKFQVYIDRNYLLFGLLAGVRGEIIPISKPRGIPEDCHTASYYYYLSELYEAKLDIKYRPIHKYLENLIELIEKRFDEVVYFGLGRKITPKQAQSIRLVFWFDN